MANPSPKISPCGLFSSRETLEEAIMEDLHTNIMETLTRRGL